MSIPEEPTQSVVELAQLGDLLQLHRPRLLAMLQRRIDPRLAAKIDAEDLLSETFLRARRKWKEFAAKPGWTPYVWLYLQALDCLKQAYRHHATAGRDLAAEQPWPDRSSLQVGFGLVQTGTSPSEAIAKEELRQSMQQALAALPPQHREILQMRHDDELSHAEAGAILGVSENAAAVRYARALKRLRELWEHLTTGPSK